YFSTGGPACPSFNHHGRTSSSILTSLVRRELAGSLAPKLSLHGWPIAIGRSISIGKRRMPYSMPSHCGIGSLRMDALSCTVTTLQSSVGSINDTFGVLRFTPYNFYSCSQRYSI